MLDNLRRGRIFAVAGDLITELDVNASVLMRSATVGETLRVSRRARPRITIRFVDPESTNSRGENPKVARVDLILGDVLGPAADRNADRNQTTRVIARFEPGTWKKSGSAYTIETTLPALDRSVYLRVRGTNGADPEPPMDELGEDPWADLWFYSNPIFIDVASR